MIVRPKYPRCDPRAVHEQGQLGSQAIRLAETSLTGEFCEALECLPLVCERHPMPGAIELWKLGRSPWNVQPRHRVLVASLPIAAKAAMSFAFGSSTAAISSSSHAQNSSFERSR